MNVQSLLELHNQGLFLLTNDFPFATKQSARAIESQRIPLAPISTSQAPTLGLCSGSCHRLHSPCSALAHGKQWGWNCHSHQQCSIFAFKIQILKEILTTETTVASRRSPLLWDVSTLHLFLRLGFKSSLYSLSSHPDHF